MPEDILSKLNRLLAVTPDTAFATPPVARRTIADAAAEIKRLRAIVDQMDMVGDDLTAIIVASSCTTA